MASTLRAAVLAALLLAGVVHAAAPASAATPPIQTTDFAGYVADTSETATKVTFSIRAPNITCPDVSNGAQRVTYFDGWWSGPGGSAGAAFEVTCVDGTRTGMSFNGYATDGLGGIVASVAMPVANVGESLFASVTLEGAGNVRVLVKNNSTGEHHPLTAELADAPMTTYNVGVHPGTSPIAAFGKTQMTNVKIDGVTIGTLNPARYEIWNGSQQLVRTSGIGSGGLGDGFTLDFVHP